MISVQSEKVKAWRNKTKSVIITAMGSKCAICGYSKSNRALALHHLIPSEKEFQIASIKASRFIWSKMVKELKKCILVCHNCHCEIHDGIISVPEIINVFDDKYSDFEFAFDLEKKSLLYDNCPICMKLKPIYLKNCSRECAGRAQFKVLWDDINLIEELKTKTICQLASELGCSDSAIHKRLKKISI